MYDYLIVGSGITGAVFAHEVTKRGRKCLVIDKRAHKGGNVYCEQVEGITVHVYGAHIFHTSDKYIWDYVNKFSAFNNFINSPIANYKGEVYNLPFNMNTFSKMWGITTPAEALSIINKQRAEITRPPQNLEEQAISLVGRDVFEKLIKGYTEKQWGRPCSELPADIIKRLPVRFTYDNNYFTDTYQGIPKDGYNAIIDKLLSGSDIRLNTDYIHDKAALSSIAKKTIYTGRIDEYFGCRLGVLEYRSLRFESTTLNQPNYQGAAVVNYTDEQTPYTRIIEHKHLNFGDQQRTVITKEYPAKWTPGAESYYPVNDEKNQRLYRQYRELALKEPSVLFCGRLAEYKYYDMDDAISAALEAANKEL